MNWIQRYKLRNYVRNSIWLLSLFGNGSRMCRFIVSAGSRTSAAGNPASIGCRPGVVRDPGRAMFTSLSSWPPSCCSCCNWPAPSLPHESSASCSGTA